MSLTTLLMLQGRRGDVEMPISLRGRWGLEGDMAVGGCTAWLFRL